jgi:NIMA (never in mitosis gene a)-related kinase
MDKYHNFQRIGKGAYGEVYSAKIMNTDQSVCIKVIDLQGASQYGPPVEREIENWKNLDHVNIVKFYEYFYSNDKLYIIIEYIEGGDLCSFVQMRKQQQQHFTEEQVLYLFRQMVSALYYLHNQKIIHRDIKPENIFLTKDYVIKLGDFGTSVVVNTIYSNQTITGTPAYVSPEMMKGIQYSFSTDIWSLGCVLYELMTFQQPFGSNIFELLNKIQNCSFQPIPDIYSNQLNNVVERMLVEEVENRISLNELILLGFSNETHDQSFYQNLVQENHQLKEEIEKLRQKDKISQNQIEDLRNQIHQLQNQASQLTEELKQIKNQSPILLQSFSSLQDPQAISINQQYTGNIHSNSHPPRYLNHNFFQKTSFNKNQTFHHQINHSLIDSSLQ